jgi:large repetitive protein
MRTSILLGLLALLSFGLRGQTPSLNVCGPNQYFCLDSTMFEICVSIIVNSDFTAPIDYFVINWGDGSPLEVIPGAGPLSDIMHEYDLTGFYNTCNYKEGRDIKLLTYVVGGNPNQPLNNSLEVFFENPPIAGFTLSAETVCLGSAVVLNNNACPTESLIIEPWDYGDGNTGADNSYTYGSAGSYTITLGVSNPCGTATATQTVEVVELPIAGATATNGITGSASADTLLVCLSDSATVQLSSGTSQFETGYTWSVVSNNAGNVIWNPAPPTPPFNQSLDPNPTLTFLSPGVYVVQLSVGSPCNVNDTDQLVFNVVPAPTASLNLDLTDCEPVTINPANLLNVSGFLSDCSWDFGPFGASDDCDPGAITFDTSTAIIFQGFNECGTIQDTGFFNLISVEQAFIDSPCADTLCTYDPPCTLSANIAGGVWTVNGQPAGPAFNPATAAAGLNTIAYGASPCILPDQVEVFVIDAEVSINGPTQLCIDGGTITYTANPPGGVFSSVQNAIDPVTGVYDPLLAGPGPDTIFYELAGNFFCPASTSLAIEVVELSVGLEVSSCNGLTICYTTTPGTSVFDNISWNFGNGQTSSQAQPCHTYSGADTYEVSVSITFGVCQVSASDFFTIEEPPNAAFTLDYATPSCGPLPVTINNQSTGDNLVYEWSYEGQTSNDPNLSQATINSPTAIVLTISNGCGSSSFSEFVDIEPTPVAGFGVNAYVCSGEPLEIFDVAILYDDIFWDFGNGQTSTTPGAQNQTYFTGLENDTVFITQIVTNVCGPDTLILPVIVVPTDAEANVTTTAAPLFQVCQYEEVCFQSFSQPSGIPLIWDFGDGQTAIASEACHSWNAPGVYEVIARLVSCGFDSTVIVITVLPAPLASFNAPLVACPEVPVQFENTSVGATGYSWDFGDGNTSTLVSPFHTFASPGTYEVCLVLSSDNNCPDSHCQTIEVAAPPIPGFSFDNPGCQGDIISFSNTSTTDIVSCAWIFGDGNISADCNPLHAYAQPGVFPVSLTVINSDGCKSTLAQNVLVGALPQAVFSVELLNPCHPVVAQFSNNSQLADGYIWDFGDGITSTLTNPQHIYQQPGDYTVTLTATKDGLCTDVAAQTITIHESPSASISLGQPAVCAGDVFAFGNASSGPITDFVWSFGDGLFSFEQNPQHAYAGPRQLPGYAHCGERPALSGC